MKKKVSVIIPAYNAGKFIDKCLDSIVNQTYKNIEIIVVNDGSKDNTQQVVQKYIDNYGIRLINQCNLGVSAARNTGMKYSSGDYLLFVDADDLLGHRAIEELCMDYFEFNVDLACCDIVDKNSSEIAKLMSEDTESFACCSKKELGEKLFLIRMGSAVGKLYKQQIITEHGLRFQEGFNLAEDIIFVHQYCMHCNCISKNAKAKYIVENINESSLSKKYVENIDSIMEQQNQVIEKLFYELPSYEESFYKYSIDINVKACFIIFKNMFLNNCPLTWKEKRKRMKKSTFVNNVFSNLPITDSYKMPKMRNDMLQYKVLCTKNVTLILCFYYIIEKLKNYYFRFRKNT